MEVESQGGVEASLLSEVGGGATGEGVVAAEAVAAASTCQVVKEVEAGGVEVPVGGEGLVGADGTASGGAGQRSRGGDEWGRDA